MNMKHSLMTLQPGMYILRHPKGGMPALSIARAAGGSGRYEVLATPGTQGAVLRDGSDCIVMHVLDGPVALLVTAYLVHADMPVPNLRVDRIALDPELALPAAPAEALLRPIEIGATGLSVIGHIEQVGDVLAAEGEVLGRPGSNLRVEGFQLMWPDKPEGLELTYGVTLEGGEALPLVGLGQFSGTRNMARRITELTFVLSGERSRQHEIQGSAQFSGGFSVPIASGATLSGPSGAEHLTTFSIRIVPATRPAKATGNAWEASARTTVFKPAPKAKAVASPDKPPAAKAVKAGKGRAAVKSQAAVKPGSEVGAQGGRRGSGG